MRNLLRPVAARSRRWRGPGASRFSSWWARILRPARIESEFVIVPRLRAVDEHWLIYGPRRDEADPARNGSSRTESAERFDRTGDNIGDGTVESVDRPEAKAIDSDPFALTAHLERYEHREKIGTVLCNRTRSRGIRNGQDPDSNAPVSTLTPMS